MIDIENEVFDRVAKRVREQFPDIFVAGEYVSSPSSFPAALGMEMKEFAIPSVQHMEELNRYADLSR